MKLWLHMVLQFILTVLQGANAEMLSIPTKWKPLVALVLSAGQMSLGAYQAYWNPDGTTAKVAYPDGTTAKVAYRAKADDAKPT
jgi:hypothetical protein